MLLRGKPVAFVLVPALIVFGVLLIVAVAGMLSSLFEFTKPPANMMGTRDERLAL